MDTQANSSEQSSPTEYKHPIFFYPLWSSIIISALIAIAGSMLVVPDPNDTVRFSLGYETLSTLLISCVVNVPIMLIIGSPIVALYRKRKLPPKWEWLVGVFVPIFGLGICGYILRFLL